MGYRLFVPNIRVPLANDSSDENLAGLLIRSFQRMVSYGDEAITRDFDGFSSSSVDLCRMFRPTRVDHFYQIIIFVIHGGVA